MIGCLSYIECDALLVLFLHAKASPLRVNVTAQAWCFGARVAEQMISTNASRMIFIL